MKRRSLASLLLLLAVTVLFGPRVARADQPGAHTVAVAVLAFDSEDAEQQADALTGALRSRIRNAQGWSLVDTTQSLGMLTAALRCPSRPPLECQQKISDQIKVDRYVWGFVSKGPTAGQVTAEVHFYQKGKPDTVIKESYADNLTDPNDDKGVGRVAARILDRLGGSAMGVVVVRAGEATGEVIVDADKHVPLSAGQARIELGAGGHSIEVSSPGAPPVKRNVLVTAGKETVVEIEGAGPAGAGGGGPSSPFPTRKVIAGSLVGVGVVLGVISIVNVAAWSSDKSKGDTDAKAVSSGVGPCEPDPAKANSVDPNFCKDNDNAKSHSTIAWITGAAGIAAIGIGAVIWLADGGSEKSALAEPKPKTRLLPTFGAATGGVSLSGAF